MFAKAISGFVWVFLRFLYRIRVRHMDRIPAGGAILAPNHVSFIDAALISAHVRRRVAFAMYWKIYNRFSWLVAPLGAIPIASKEENAEVYEAAFVRMKEELDAGNLVCIFPEGMLTLDGELNPFRNGILKLLALSPEAQIVPVALKGLWGTYFSKKKRGMFKLPDRWMTQIEMDIGPILTRDRVDALEPTVRRMLALPMV